MGTAAALHGVGALHNKRGIEMNRAGTLLLRQESEYDNANTLREWISNTTNRNDVAGERGSLMRSIAPTQRMSNGMAERNRSSGWDGIANGPRPLVGWDPTASSSFKSALKVKPKRNLSRPQSRQGGSRDRRVSETLPGEPVKIVWGTPKKNPLK